MSAKALEQESFALLSANFALSRLIDLHFLEHSITPRIAIEIDSLSLIVETISSVDPSLPFPA